MGVCGCGRGWQTDELKEWGIGLLGNLPLPTHPLSHPHNPPHLLPLWSAILGLGSWGIVTLARWGSVVGRGCCWFWPHKQLVAWVGLSQKSVLSENYDYSSCLC